MRVVIKRTHFQKNYKRLQPLKLHDLTLFTRQIDKVYLHFHMTYEH